MTKEKYKLFKKLIVFEILTIKLYRYSAKKALKKKNTILAEKLNEMANQDINHLEILNNEIDKKITKVCPFRLFWHLFLNFLFGITFSLRVLEKIEVKLVDKYENNLEKYPVLKQIFHEDKKHKKNLEEFLEVEQIEYVSMVVLGLNDALVEMSGAIAGFTLSLGNNTRVFLIGIITGIAASLSMGASSFLTSRQLKGFNPFIAAFLTFISYFVTVIFLTIPYLIFSNTFMALGLMIFFGLLIIIVFNYYLSVTKNQSFFKNFMIMAGIAIVVTFITFGIGALINHYFPNY